MGTTWFASDHHLGHKNIILFKDNDNKIIRDFKTIEDHDEHIIAEHNKLVKPEDRMYFMGDVAINRRSLPLISRMNGRKKLIKGNHDIFKLKDYLPYFEDIISYRIYPKQGIIVSHIPIYSGQMDEKARWNWNVHGHTHANNVKRATSGPNDSRYLNLCLEKTNYKPISFDQILDRIGWEPEQERIAPKVKKIIWWT